MTNTVLVRIKPTNAHNVECQSLSLEAYVTLTGVADKNGLPLKYLNIFYHGVHVCIQLEMS